MPDKQTTSRDLSDLPILLVSREEAKQRLSDQITRGTAFLESLDERIKALPPEKGFIHILTNGHPRYDLSLESREEYEQWMKYIETLFAITFKGDEYLTEFRRERAKPDLSLVSHYVDGVLQPAPQLRSRAHCTSWSWSPSVRSGRVSPCSAR